MFTLFTIPKGFTHPHINIIQRNAIQSWKRLHPEIQIVLVGNDPGVDAVAAEYGVTHIPDVDVNEFNTPILSSAFQLVRDRAMFDTMVYINADIMLTSGFLDVVRQAQELDNYLVVGRRTDIDITELLDFDTADWESQMNDRLAAEGTVHGPWGSDYFIFHKTSFTDIPDFAVGRPGWDNWMIGTARDKGMMTIDASSVYKVIHQNHDYRHIGGRKNEKTNPEAKRNRELAPGDLYGLEYTNYVMKPNGVRKKYIDLRMFVKRIQKLFKS